MQKARLLILVMLLTLVLVPANSFIASAQEDAVFATPEDAIALFFEGVVEGDLGKILQSSAVNNIAENFEFELSVDRMRAFLPIQSPAPSDYPFFVEINRAESTARLSSQVKMLAYSLLAGDAIEYDRTMIMELAGAEALVPELDPSRLATLEVVEVTLPSPEILSSDRYKENAFRIAVTYGADESTERVALLSFEGETYLLGFSLLLYGDSWQINNLFSAIAATPAIGTATPITPEEFADLTS